MVDYLVNYAAKNIWCTPNQDKQYIFQLARLTPFNGVSVSWKVLMTSMRVPEVGSRFHFFQIGLVYPALVDLFPVMNTWTKLSDSSMRTRTLCDIYLANGLRLNSSQCWYIVTEERNVIIAVKELRQLGKLPGVTQPPITFGTDAVYMRVYSNAYYNSDRWNAFKASILPTVITNPIEIHGVVAKTTQDILDLQTKYLQLNALPGKVFVYRNGYRVPDIGLVNSQVGDILEIVYDASVYKKVLLDIKDLQTFTSYTDKLGKYLLHYSDQQMNTIDYQDDVDCALLDKNTLYGIYYHKNAGNSLRMVTHKDYSTPVAQVAAFLQTHSTLLSHDSTSIELCIRASGWKRSLVDEHHRIKELYKLDDSRIIPAMVGLDSTVSAWSASSLEASAYTTVMRSKFKNLTKQLVTQALGYNAAAKLLAEHIHIVDATLTVTLPELYIAGCTAFEYDSNGHLLGWYTHTGGPIYNCVNASVKYVELMVQNCDITIDDYYDVRTITIDPNYDYRFYICPLTTNPQTDDWIDVTGDFTKYIVSSNVATWMDLSATHHTLVRSNKKTLINTINVNQTDGLLVFNLYQSRPGDTVLPLRNLEIPMGELDVFLNKKKLINGLDYHVSFPTVSICSKQHLDPSGVQEIIYRFSGHCDRNIQMRKVSEFGFVRNGRLSYDHEFDIRDDKVMIVNLQGGIRTVGECVFNEDTATFDFASSMNGMPYEIKDIVIPLTRYTGLDTYTLKGTSEEIDKQISNYLTKFKPTPESNTINPIPAQYTLFSPFLAKIAADLKSGILADPIMRAQYSDNVLMELVANYVYLLKMDPILEDNRPNKEFVIIHPTHLSTILDLDIYQYTFLNRVIRLYAQGLVNLSGHARIV